MPYISDEKRTIFEHSLAQLSAHIKTENADAQAGVLNYCISSIINEVLKTRKNYHAINEMIGVLECAKLELYRRVASPYEDEKIESNGDVFDC